MPVPAVTFRSKRLTPNEIAGFVSTIFFLIELVKILDAAKNFVLGK